MKKLNKYICVGETTQGEKENTVVICDNIQSATIDEAMDIARKHMDDMGEKYANVDSLRIYEVGVEYSFGYRIKGFDANEDNEVCMFMSDRCFSLIQREDTLKRMADLIIDDGFETFYIDDCDDEFVAFVKHRMDTKYRIKDWEKYIILNKNCLDEGE